MVPWSFKFVVVVCSAPLNPEQGCVSYKKCRSNPLATRFEKFNWFVSSENYLVLGARDPSQADQLFLRVMTSRDVYVHADVRGGAPETAPRRLHFVSSGLHESQPTCGIKVKIWIQRRDDTIKIARSRRCAK